MHFRKFNIPQRKIKMTTTNTQQLSKDLASLPSVISRISIISVLISMTAYTVLECIIEGGVNPTEVLTHHVLPTLLIGVFIWLALHFFLRKALVNPLSKICQHLSKISNGQLSILDERSNIREVKKIIWGINMLATKLKEAPTGVALKDSVDDVISLRGSLQTVAEEHPEILEQLVPSLVALEDLEKNIQAACMFEVTRSKITA